MIASYFGRIMWCLILFYSIFPFSIFHFCFFYIFLFLLRNSFVFVLSITPTSLRQRSCAFCTWERKGWGGSRACATSASVSATAYTRTHAHNAHNAHGSGGFNVQRSAPTYSGLSKKNAFTVCISGYPGVVNNHQFAFIQNSHSCFAQCL